MSRARDIADLSSVSTRLDTLGATSGSLGNRRLTINGSMAVAQRGSVAGLQTGYGACDRFKLQSTSAARFDTSQSTDVPSGQGFAYSLKLDCSTADTSLASGDYYFIMHQMEGLNLQHLKYGTSDAVQCTLSFWVKSPKTGIHNVEINHIDGSKFNIYQYTIASANTWQKVSFTFDGNTAAVINNDNTAGLVVVWWLLGGTTYTGGSYTQNSWTSSNANRAVGQVNVADSTSNDFYLTGVQLEVGAQETDFEHKNYSDDYDACQRYYQKHTTGSNQYTIFLTGSIDTTSNIYMYGKFNGTMRTSPAFSTANTYLYTQPGGVLTYSGTANRSGPDTASINFASLSSGTQGYGIRFESNVGNGYVEYDAEL